MPLHESSSSALHPNKRLEPTVQIVIDCKGQPVLPGFLGYTQSLLSQLRGVDYVQNLFWVTRTDLQRDYQARNMSTMNPFRVGEEPRHEASFDLYEEGGTVPVARLVNVAPALQWDDLEMRP